MEPPGIGKTSCVRFVFRELSEKLPDVKGVFINCWKNPTTNVVLAEIARQTGATATMHKTNDELWSKIEQAIGRVKGIALCLDEIDKAKEYDFLYQIAENMKNSSVIMITNEKEFLADIDPRVRSRMPLEEVEFREYKRHEIEGILRERVKYAFYPEVFGEEAFELVVEKTSEQKDVRIGLFLLKEAGRMAERDASKKVRTEHVMEAKEKLIEFRIKTSDDLGDREKRVLEVIRKNSGIVSGELNELCPDIPHSTMRRITQKLEKGGFIFREECVSPDGAGRTMKHFVDE